MMRAVEPVRDPAPASSRRPRVGVLSGAGVSAWAPAGLPTGSAFHHRLNELCRERAAGYADGIVDDAVLDAIRVSRLNILARLENTCPGVGASALAAMKVHVPNEAHLLAALHLAAGGLHMTVNFDDGVERAYALLSGASELPAPDRSTFQASLDAWRRLWPVSAPGLRVVSRPGHIGAALNTRPLLVKFHGSLGRHPDGVTIPFPPVTDEPDAGEWGGERRSAIAALAAEGLVLVTGFSGTDLASRTALLDELDRSGATLVWASAEVEPWVREIVAAVDPTQPRLAEPVDALRDRLGCTPPPWPRDPASGPSFDARLDDWASRVSHEVAAEALGWALADSNRPDEGVEILHRLMAGRGRSAPAPGPRPTCALRLADALVRRDGAGDRKAAQRLLVADLAALRGTGTARGARGYAAARLAELSVLAPQGSGSRTARRVKAMIALQAARGVALTAPSRSHPTASVRAATIATSVVLEQLERELPAALSQKATKRVLDAVAADSQRSARRVAACFRWAPHGRRGALLRRQMIELEVIRALLAGQHPEPGVLTQLGRLWAVFEHVADPDGVADTEGTRALAHLAASRRAAARSAVADADAWGRNPRGVVELARALIDLGVGSRVW